MKHFFRSWRPRLFGALLHPSRQKNRRRTVLAGGFLAIMLVIATMIGVSLYSLAQSRMHLVYLADHQQRKLAAVASMRENLFLRVVASRDMLLMTDPFEIDEAVQRFNIYPTRIGVAYTRFRELADNPLEIALVEKFIDEARRGMPLLDQAVHMLNAGQQPSAIKPLLQQAFQTQEQGLQTLDTLYASLLEQSSVLARQAVERHDITRLLILALFVTALIAVLVIAAIVVILLEHNAAELEREHRKFKTLFEASHDAVLILQEGRILEWNRRALAWFDRSGAGQLTGLCLDDISIHDDEATPHHGQHMLDQLSAQGGGNFEWKFKDRDEQPFYGEVSLTPLPGDTPPQVQLVIRDITLRRLAMMQMSHAATHDPLTGLANRREFEQRLQRAIDHTRTSDRPQLLCYLDLDKFKPVNDHAGHVVGDELLKQIAALLKTRIRSADLLARLGGDEFGLLLEGCSVEKARFIAHSLIRAVEELRFSVDGGLHRVGISIGLVKLEAGSSVTSALAAADQACYAAKRAGTHFEVSKALSDSEV